MAMNEFQAHLRWLAEQRRLADLERRWREAERQALRELYLAALEDEDGSDDLSSFEQNDLSGGEFHEGVGQSDKSGSDCDGD